MILPILFVIFVGVPIVEIWLIIQVGHAVGGLDTLLILIADSLVGSWLVRREGLRAWTRLREALSEARMPTKELADGALVVIGGMLLILPGFLSDVIGLICILPFTRPLVRVLLLRRVASRTTVTEAGGVRIVDVQDHHETTEVRRIPPDL